MTFGIPSVTSTMKKPSFAISRWRQARGRWDDRSEVADRGRTSAVDVLYVGGCQRSGSTLLDRMLGQTQGHISAGEITHLWARGVGANDLCGCGERFADCPFWSEVGRVGVRRMGGLGCPRNAGSAAPGRSESLHHLHALAGPLVSLSPRPLPLRRHPRPALSGDPAGGRRRGRRGFLEARVDRVPPPQGAVRADACRAPRA